MKVLISDSISATALSVLRSSRIDFTYKPEISSENLVREIAEYDALIVRSRTKVTREVILPATKLRIIGRAGVGLDNIDLKATAERKVKVVNTPYALTNAVAEFTIGLMIALARQIPKAVSSMRSGKWEKSSITGSELKGKTYGTIGIGRIGARVSELAHAFGMKIMANDVIPIPKDLIDRLGISVASRDQILSEADFVDIHVPLTPETENMIGYREFSLMKKSAFIINTSRGKVINESDLLKALSEKKVAGAALDVFEVEPPNRLELLKSEKVIPTPHIAGQTEEAQNEAGRMVAEQVVEYLKSA
jgi:D-3-phosphoglycerate dehydrogenase / 2-oxoglutarate reductase